MLKKHPAMEADYIIVGAGSAGCVLANRLSANPDVSVILIEAGKSNQSWKVTMPAALTYNLENDRHNWYYHTEPQAAMNNRKLYWPRGKMVGGSSSLNAMVYIRGHRQDFNRWHDEGALNWHYDHVLSYFKRSERFSRGGDYYRGASGPLSVVDKISENPLFDAFIEAGMQAGFPYSRDLNGAQQEGFGRFDMTIHNGERCSAASAYLYPILRERRNLRVITEAQTTKVIIQHNKAVGVEYYQRGKLKRGYANREIILSAGALNSPHLLMLSGIGPAQMLSKQGIDTVVDLKGVGANLQDHLEFYMQYECQQPVTLFSMTNPIRKVAAGMQWFLARKGVCATSHLEAGGFVKSRSDVLHPDIQYHFLPSLVNDHGRDLGNCHAFQVHVGTLRPDSRGYLELASSNPLTPLKIHANYLQTENDLRDLMAAVPMTRDIFQQSAFSPYMKREIQPGMGCRTQQEIEAFVRAKADSAYHPCGTCKMGIDENAVVDPEARVIGVSGLRVADASIMPSNLSGNLNAATIMIGEKVSDMVQGNHGFQDSKR